MPCLMISQITHSDLLPSAVVLLCSVSTMNADSMTGLMLLWLFGAATMGVALHWDHSSASPVPHPAQMSHTEVISIDRHDDRVGLRIHLPGLPWTLSLVADVPNSMHPVLSETHSAKAGRAMPDYQLTNQTCPSP